MILRNHTYLKVYKCWWILPILKTPTIKCLAIFFKKYFNFQVFYIVYIINWPFLGWKKFTPSKLGEKGLQKFQNGKSFFGENALKISHGLNFALKTIPIREGRCPDIFWIAHFPTVPYRHVECIVGSFHETLR